jgi:hypothetical protein
MADVTQRCANPACRKALAPQSRNGICSKCSRDGTFKPSCSKCGDAMRLKHLRRHETACRGLRTCAVEECRTRLATNNRTGVCTKCKKGSGVRVRCSACGTEIHPGYHPQHARRCEGRPICAYPTCENPARARAGSEFCGPAHSRAMPVDCPKGCGVVSRRHLARHLRDCDGAGTSCRFCGVDCQSQGHRKQHEVACPDNPDCAPALPFHGSRLRKRQLVERDGPGCMACGSTDSELAEDHCFAQNLMKVVDPENTLNWVDGLWNLELLCQFTCNLSKRDKIWPEQAERALERFPGEETSVLRGLMASAQTWPPGPSHTPQ